MRNSSKKISAELKASSIVLLFRQIRKIDSPEGVERLLDLVLTDSEKDALLRRIAAVILRSRGKKYRAIEDLIGVSRATISRAKQIASLDGYGRNLGMFIYSQFPGYSEKKKRKSLLGTYKGAESIL